MSAPSLCNQCRQTPCVCYRPLLRRMAEQVDRTAEALIERNAEIQRLRQGLWDCAIATGFDNDGNLTPRSLVHPDIVELALREVRRLRADYDEAIS